MADDDGVYFPAQRTTRRPARPSVSNEKAAATSNKYKLLAEQNDHVAHPALQNDAVGSGDSYRQGMNYAPKSEIYVARESTRKAAEARGEVPAVPAPRSSLRAAPPATRPGQPLDRATARRQLKQRSSAFQFELPGPATTWMAGAPDSRKAVANLEGLPPPPPPAAARASVQPTNPPPASTAPSSAPRPAAAPAAVRPAASQQGQAPVRPSVQQGQPPVRPAAPQPGQAPAPPIAQPAQAPVRPVAQPGQPPVRPVAPQWGQTPVRPAAPQWGQTSLRPVPPQAAPATPRPMAPAPSSQSVTNGITSSGQAQNTQQPVFVFKSSPTKQQANGINGTAQTSPGPASGSNPVQPVTTSQSNAQGTVNTDNAKPQAATASAPASERFAACAARIDTSPPPEVEELSTELAGLSLGSQPSLGASTASPARSVTTPAPAEASKVEQPAQAESSAGQPTPTPTPSMWQQQAPNWGQPQTSPATGQPNMFAGQQMAGMNPAMARMTPEMMLMFQNMTPEMMASFMQVFYGMSGMTQGFGTGMTPAFPPPTTNPFAGMSSPGSFGVGPFAPASKPVPPAEPTPTPTVPATSTPAAAATTENPDDYIILRIRGHNDVLYELKVHRQDKDPYRTVRLFCDGNGITAYASNVWAIVQKRLAEGGGASA
ncbi:hypothetical protein DFS34DRAFT_627571 [Phlyctochytrium arcticum]|nr:hypothetical protein DFS34DRAFT_627571 [Phlyctochytrium arcticum]